MPNSRRKEKEKQMCTANAILTLLQGCNSMQRLRKIHAQVLVSGYSDYPSITTKLLYFCAVSSSGDLPYARHLFAHIQNPQTDDWNSMIRGSSQSLSPLDSLFLYNTMMRSGDSRPDHHTFSFLLKACERARTENKCREAHASIVRYGYAADVVVTTNLVRSYAEIGRMEVASQLFNEMPERDLVSWNSMIACCCRAGLHEEALKVYDEMKILGVAIDEFTAVGLLSSCAHLGALDFGIRVHRFAEESGFCTANVFVGNALIEMYAKCGSLDAAHQVFYGMLKHDIFTWNSMIVGLGIHGRGDEAISFFRRMLVSGIRPNPISFLGLLVGCNHQGLLKEGLHYFGAMSREFGLKPDVKHYGCIVDMFGRAGNLEKALEIIRSSPWSHDPVLWRALLSACKIHGNVEMGELAINNLVRLGGHNAGDCALLAGIYTKAGDRLGVARVRKMVKDQGIKTTPGWSWIEVCGVVRSFFVGEVSHHDSEEIYEKLKEVISRAASLGYVRGTSRMLEPENGMGEWSEESSEDGGGGYHSEKLAIAFGLVRTPAGSSLRIVKNLRVCRDCHSFTKFVSKAYGRQIIVRDRLRFHHFKSGTCSCNDYW